MILQTLSRIGRSLLGLPPAMPAATPQPSTFARLPDDPQVAFARPPAPRQQELAFDDIRKPAKKSAKRKRKPYVMLDKKYGYYAAIEQLAAGQSHTIRAENKREAQRLVHNMSNAALHYFGAGCYTTAREGRIVTTTRLAAPAATETKKA